MEWPQSNLKTRSTQRGCEGRRAVTPPPLPRPFMVLSKQSNCQKSVSQNFRHRRLKEGRTPSPPSNEFAERQGVNIHPSGMFRVQISSGVPRGRTLPPTPAQGSPNFPKGRSRSIPVGMWEPFSDHEVPQHSQISIPTAPQPNIWANSTTQMWPFQRHTHHFSCSGNSNKPALTLLSLGGNWV